MKVPSSEGHLLSDGMLCKHIGNLNSIERKMEKKYVVLALG